MAVLYSADFEGGTSPFDSGDTASFSVQSTGAHGGIYRLAKDASATHRNLTDSASSWSNTDGGVLSALLRCDTGGTNIATLRFGAESSGQNGYGVCIDARNGVGGGNTAFQIRENNGSTAIATDSAPTITVGTWYRIEVEWQGSSPRITARLYSEDRSTLLSTLTSDDASYSSGRIGLHGYAATSYDSISIVADDGGTDYSLAVELGSFAATGSAAGLKTARKTAAETGAFTATGAPASLRVARKLAASSGTYAASGQAISLGAFKRVSAASAQFGSSGQPAGLVAARRLVAGSGSSAIFGADAGLEYGATSAFGITAEAGAFVATGASASLKRGIRFSATPTSVNATRSIAALRRGLRLSAAGGASSAQGAAVTLTHAHRMVADGVDIDSTGQDAILLATRRLLASAPTYAATGGDVVFSTSGGAFLLQAVAGGYIVLSAGAGFAVVRIVPRIPTLPRGAATAVAGRQAVRPTRPLTTRPVQHQTGRPDGTKAGNAARADRVSGRNQAARPR